MGYYVELMLVEPGVRPDEVVIAPPSDLDRTHPSSRSSFARPASEGSAGDVGADAANATGAGGRGGAFRRDVYASRQFNVPGPWERANAKAFGEICLDVRKALARVEFPAFPEGCGERTFREVYQLNARVSASAVPARASPRRRTPRTSAHADIHIASFRRRD